MPVRQWVNIEPVGEELTCAARGPQGWWCCLIKGHFGNHIGVTLAFGKLSQWEQDDAHNTP